MQCSGRLARVRTQEWWHTALGGTGSRAGLVLVASSMLRGHRGTARLPRVNAAVGSGTRERAVPVAARAPAGTTGSALAGVLSGWFSRVRSGKRRKGSHAFPPVAGERAFSRAAGDTGRPGASVEPKISCRIDAWRAPSTASKRTYARSYSDKVSHWQHSVQRVLYYCVMV